MADHIEREATPLRRSRRLLKDSCLTLAESEKEDMAVLKETEGESSNVIVESDEEKHDDEETGMEVIAAPIEGEQLLPHGGDAVLTKEEMIAPTSVVTAPDVLICDESLTEKPEEKRKPLESISEPCKRPFLGVREPKVKSDSLADKKGIVIPKGKPKSGRIWKDTNKKRFSGMVKDRPLHTSWDKKMAARREKSLMKDFSQRLKDDKRKAKEEKKQRREENLKRRLENERKAEVVQVITNLAKLKRAKKKQLRRIEKRDTLALAQRGSGLNKKAERLAKFLKKKKEATDAKENTN